MSSSELRSTEEFSSSESLDAATSLLLRAGGTRLDESSSVSEKPRLTLQPSREDGERRQSEKSTMKTIAVKKIKMSDR